MIPGRAKATANPQTFNWESLRAPVLVEDFSEIYTRLSTLPPTSLRPRRLTENFYICALANSTEGFVGVEAVEFSSVEQSVKAILRDFKGNQITLIHPYTHRNRAGTEALLSSLHSNSLALRFVAGQVSLSGTGLVLVPISLVFQQGETRTVLQPWIERGEGEQGSRGVGEQERITESDPLVLYLEQVKEAIAELFLTGLQQAQEPTTRLWRSLHQSGTSLGLVRSLSNGQACGGVGTKE